MVFFSDFAANTAFGVAFVAWFIAQFLKIPTYYYYYRKFDITRFLESGGMPSSHTSFVIGLTTAVGKLAGYDAPIFAVSLVFSLIVMYDASGVRRSVGKQAKLLNYLVIELFEHKHLEEEKLKELVGHTPFEVIAGAILGMVVGNLML
jgi:acid phosphatase family membrane protein YuiD